MERILGRFRGTRALRKRAGQAEAAHADDANAWLDSSGGGLDSTDSRERRTARVAIDEAAINLLQSQQARALARSAARHGPGLGKMRKVNGLVPW